MKYNTDNIKYIFFYQVKCLLLVTQPSLNHQSRKSARFVVFEHFLLVFVCSSEPNPPPKLNGLWVILAENSKPILT